MVIEKIKLQNFGRHELVDKDIDSPVVGLLGPNGCGKSTVLTAIEFAFTGKLDGDSKLWVRYFDSPEGASNAVVEIWFRKEHQEGYIMRQVGKSPKRLLRWDGREIKSAKEVEDTLEEILGVDKSAIASSVFIRQGEVKQLIEGTNAQREELLTKLLVLSYIEERKKAIDKKTEIISGGIEDFSVMIDEQKTRLGEALASANSSSNKLQGIPSVKPEIDRLVDLDKACEKRDGFGQNISILKSRLSQVEQSFSQANHRLKQFTRGAALEDFRNSLKSLRQGLQHSLSKFDAAESKVLSIKSLEGDRDRLSRTVNTTYQDLSDAKKNVEGISLSELESKIETKKLHSQLAARLKEISNDIQELNKVISSNAESNYEKDQVDLDKEQLNRLQNEITELTMKVKLHSLLEGHDLAECPLCKSEIDSNRLDDLNELQEVLEDKTKKSRHIRDCIKSLEDEENERLSDIKKASEGLIAKQLEYIKVSQEKMGLTPEAKESLHDMVALSEEVIKSERSIAVLEERIKTTEAEAELVTRKLLELRKEEVEVFPENYKADTEKHIKKIDDDLEGLQTLSNALSNAQNSKEAISEQVAEQEAKWEEQNNVVENLVECEEDLNTIVRRERLEKLKVSEGERQELVGQLNALNCIVNNERERLKNLEDRQDSNVAKRQLVNDLKLLQGAFSKTGVKEMCIRKRFEQLCALTQEFLVELEANFTIDLDPDNATSFMFTRVDEEVQYPLPMSKLSGGQKVRLALAFLMSVQKLVVPEVAFLVVDEPSDGLDEEGIDSFRELIINMKHRLTNSDSQIILCEHRNQLHSAFDKKIELVN